MARRYTVYIEGKPLVIAGTPPDKLLEDGWIAVRIDADTEMARAVNVLVKRPEVQGMLLFSASGEDLWDGFRAGYKFVAAAGGVVVDESGRLLAIRRLGKWDLPKGKVEKDETIEVAAIREVMEECGLTKLELLSPLAETWHTYERKGRQHLKCTHWFLMRGSAKETLTPQADEDIEEVRWLDEAGVKGMELDTYPSLLPVIQAWRGTVTRPRP
ncbi:MAG: NUDIX domain-containing protein [Flavobacteriales bacterium]